MQSLEGILVNVRCTPNDPARVAYSHLTKYISKIEEWKTLKAKGHILVNRIQSMQLDEVIDEEFPKQLLPLSNSLVEVGKAMKLIIEDLSGILAQMNALSKLYPTTEHRVKTWSIARTTLHLKMIYYTFEQEMNLKQTVIENICHTQDECLTEVYVSSWEYDVFINEEDINVLKAEVNAGAFIPSLSIGIKSP